MVQIGQASHRCVVMTTYRVPRLVANIRFFIDSRNRLLGRCWTAETALDWWYLVGCTVLHVCDIELAFQWGWWGHTYIFSFLTFNSHSSLLIVFWPQKTIISGNGLHLCSCFSLSTFASRRQQPSGTYTALLSIWRGCRRIIQGSLMPCNLAIVSPGFVGNGTIASPPADIIAIRRPEFFLDLSRVDIMLSTWVSRIDVLQSIHSVWREIRKSVTSYIIFESFQPRDD